MKFISRHILFTALTLAGLVQVSIVHASGIVAPHGSGRDSDLAGNTVAMPDDGSSASLINPAGVVSRAKDEFLFAVTPGTVITSYKNPATGYNGEGDSTFATFSAWYGLGEHWGWSMGLGGYGSLGAAFEMPEAPAIGQTSRYTGKLGIMNFVFNAGREVMPGLRIGLQISPAYGTQHVRLPSPLGNIEFETDGFGISGAAGLVYEPSDDWSFGLAYRSRGIVELEGDGNVGASREDVDVDLVTPQSVTGGASYQWSDKLILHGQLRWTRYEDFEDGDVEFENTTALNQPVIGNARNRLRWGAAFEYELFPGSFLRAGYTAGKAMIEDESVTPILYDHDNDMIMLGYEIDYGNIMLGVTTGYMLQDPRRLSAAENPQFPGVYETDSGFSAGFRMTWKLDRT